MKHDVKLSVLPILPDTEPLWNQAYALALQVISDCADRYWAGSAFDPDIDREILVRLKNGTEVCIRRRPHALPMDRRKALARTQVSLAVKTGALIRPTECAVCFMEHRYIEAHHEDYSKPLDVLWLCRPCHREVHRAAKIASSA